MAIAVPKPIRSASIYPGCVDVSRLIDDDHRVSVLIDTGTATCRALATQLHARHLPYLSIQVTGHDRPRQDNAATRFPVYLHVHVKPFRPPFLSPLPSTFQLFAVTCDSISPKCVYRFRGARGAKSKPSRCRWTDRRSRRNWILSLCLFSLAFRSSRRSSHPIQLNAEYEFVTTMNSFDRFFILIFRKLSSVSLRIVSISMYELIDFFFILI